ncbi:MAG: hypothetical protein V1794_02650 [Candidatus Glassbacteria bacterium]
MFKKSIFAVVAVFVVWTALDYVIHQLILGPAYAATAQLWRPMEEIKMGLMTLVTLLAAIAFVAVYARLIGDKCLTKGLEYGFWFGFGAGVSMGYGMYSVTPISCFMASTWFIGSLVEALAAGLVTGLIVRQPNAAPQA